MTRSDILAIILLALALIGCITVGIWVGHSVASQECQLIDMEKRMDALDGVPKVTYKVNPLAIPEILREYCQDKPKGEGPC
jgi:hypothetical protein